MAAYEYQNCKGVLEALSIVGLKWSRYATRVDENGNVDGFVRTAMYPCNVMGIETNAKVTLKCTTALVYIPRLLHNVPTLHRDVYIDIPSDFTTSCTDMHVAFHESGEFHIAYNAIGRRHLFFPTHDAVGRLITPDIHAFYSAELNAMIHIADKLAHDVLTKAGF
jgi:hypothetical protein